MNGQILLLAKDLGHTFVKQDGAFEELFVETVGREINRSEGQPEPQQPEAESDPWNKLWAAASVSEDGSVAAVDPADMKAICRMGQESLAAAQAAGATGGHAIGMSAYQSVCSPGANVTAAWYRLTMLGLCERFGLLSAYKSDGEFSEAVFQVAATFPMKRMEAGVTYHGLLFDTDEFVRRIERASAG